MVGVKVLVGVAEGVCVKVRVGVSVNVAVGVVVNVAVYVGVAVAVAVVVGVAEAVGVGLAKSEIAGRLHPAIRNVTQRRARKIAECDLEVLCSLIDLFYRITVVNVIVQCQRSL